MKQPYIKTKQIRKHPIEFKKLKKSLCHVFQDLKGPFQPKPFCDSIE